jgi:hypothetical protein
MVVKWETPALHDPGESPPRDATLRLPFCLL